jgi:hypothetical protein
MCPGHLNNDEVADILKEGPARYLSHHQPDIQDDEARNALSDMFASETIGPANTVPNKSYGRQREHQDTTVREVTLWEEANESTAIRQLQ